ncbi:MAG: GGDEF domain-containing protein [Pararhizobium sp.]
MADLFSIPTLLICTSTVTFLIAIALSLAWVQDRRPAGLGVWCLALWVGTAASVLLGLRTLVSFDLSIGVGNMLGAAAYSIMWVGSRAFDGRSKQWRLALLAPLVWIVLFSCLPAIHDNVNGRIVLMSVLVGVYAGATGFEILRSNRIEPLPIRKLASAVFTTHALVYLARIPLVVYAPPQFVKGSGYSTWYALITFELFVHTMCSAVIILALIKERAEARYRHASERDPLTGIFNRRSFFERVEKELARRPAGVMLLLDIDHFKSVNDGYGHLVGDRILVAFSECVAGALGKGAIFGRFGGEEFAVFLPRAEQSEGIAVAERLRECVSRTAVVHMGNRIGITVSIGAADATTVAADFDALIGAADLVLYEAKRKGRNRIAAYDPVRHLSAIAERGRTAPAIVDAATAVSAAG